MAVGISVGSGKDERGATAVEFALVLVPLVAVLFGIVQYGMYFYSAQSGSNAVNAAVRQLSVGNCQTSTALNTYLSNQVGRAATGTITTTVTYTNPDGTTPLAPAAANVGIGGKVTLTISYPTLNLHFPFIPFLSDSKVTRTAQARVEDTTDQGCS